jgi:NAD(P)-dependent dehydrogenase (short-subunit alcohol dehydrogenase family)
LSSIGQGGCIDTLINNAAIDPRIALEKTSLADWDSLFAVNLRSYFLTCREASTHMGQGSSIINFSSITFHTGPSNMTAYVATKGGILAFTRALARELGPRRIRVNTISPGWIMTERQLRDFVDPSVKRLIKRSQCIPELLQPGEIADVALFLASSASRALTGQELLADRGWAYS